MNNLGTWGFVKTDQHSWHSLTTPTILGESWAHTIQISDLWCLLVCHVSGPAMLVMDWVLKVSACSLIYHSYLLHHDHHVSPPIPVPMVIRAQFNLQSWLTTSRSYLNNQSFNDIGHFQLFNCSTISVKISLVVFTVIHVIQTPPSHHLLAVHCSSTGGENVVVVMMEAC